MDNLARKLLTPEEYLEIERKAEFKSEFYAGEMIIIIFKNFSFFINKTNNSQKNTKKAW